MKSDPNIDKKQVEEIVNYLIQKGNHKEVLDKFNNEWRDYPLAPFYRHQVISYLKEGNIDGN